MSDVVSFAEIDGQCVELLLARTMLQAGGGTADLAGGTGVGPAPASTTTGLLGSIPVVGVVVSDLSGGLTGA